MRYTKYGTFLGGLLTMCILIGYTFFKEVENKVTLPYIFISMLIYFYLLGFYTAMKTNSVKEGLKAGLIAGAISMIFVGVSFLFVHTVLYYYDSISDPAVLARFKMSGLLSMQRFLIYDSIRMDLIYFTIGTFFAGLSSGAGSITASHLHKSNSMSSHGSPHVTT